MYSLNAQGQQRLEECWKTLKKSYKKPEALPGVDFDVARGSIFALLDMQRYSSMSGRPPR